jgi:hypothetical protein
VKGAVMEKLYLLHQEKKDLEIRLTVPKREKFDHSDFHDFYAIKSLTVSDFGVKIKICLQNI